MKMIQDQKYCEIAHSESDCEPMELIDVEGRRMTFKIICVLLMCARYLFKINLLENASIFLH